MVANRHPLQISEARKRLSALVERVARGGAPVAIGRYGRERAVLISVDEYARLEEASSRTGSKRTLEGILTLSCSPEDLIAESRQLGELWLASLEGRQGRGSRTMSARSRARSRAR